MSACSAELARILYGRCLVRLRTTVIAVGKKKYHGLYNYIIYIGLKHGKKVLRSALDQPTVTGTGPAYSPWSARLAKAGTRAEIC